MTSMLTHIACLECGHVMEAQPGAVGAHPPTCPQCGSPWLDARYDYDAVAQQWPTVLARRPMSLWRYAELLPIFGPDPEISMGEGYTPLHRLYQYEKQYDHPHIYVKDERAQPTNSFKDRQAALSVTAMRQQGITECVLASTGNAAVAYAAYCARAGIKLWLFLTSLAPAEKMREVALYGAEVVRVSGTYDETKKVAAEFAARKGLYMDTGAKKVPSKESMKTLAFEIAEQLGLQQYPDEPGRWVAPDWYIQAVSGGIGPLGVWKGFSELYHMRLIDHMPKLGIVQAAGCAPMVAAFEAGAEQAEPVVPKTLIHVLATGAPGHAYVLLREAVLHTGGTMIAIEDGETFVAMRHLASRSGISVEPATAVAFAGLERMLQDGTIAPGEHVVVNASGHTLPAESHILGDQYDRYILNLEMHNSSSQGPREEGLGAALQNLDEQVTTVVVVDDNANDRRLIRRLLQSYKNYRVYEARDGEEAMRVVLDRKPDLVVSDLTMPGTDGFTLLEMLKTHPETMHIPVVVVSAKSLTAQDRATLQAYSDSVWLKGGFETRELVDHVVSTLGHTPVDVLKRPGRSQDEAAAPQPSAPPRPASPAENDERAVIVVIDDNVNDLRLARRMLESQDAYHVITTETGRDGLKAIYNYHPDLIVLDLMLPDLDGFSILEALQRDDKLREIPVIIFSAKNITDAERLALKDNIRTVLEKANLDRHEFLRIIESELK